MSRLPEYQKQLLIVLSIFIITLLAHINVLRNSYVLDDFRLIVNNDFISKQGNIKVIFDLKQFLNPVKIVCGARPLTIISLMLDYFFWQLNPFGYHLTNLMLHGLNSILVYVLCYLLIKNNSHKYLSSIFAALAFALHPVVSETVNIASFRGDLLATFFYLNALILYLAVSKTYGNIAKTIFYTIIFFCFILALHSKEIALSFPFIIIIGFILRSNNPVVQDWVIIVSLIAISLGFFLFYWAPRYSYFPGITFFPNIENNMQPLSSMPVYLNTILSSFMHNLKVLFWPFNLSIDYSVYVPKALLNIINLAAIAVITISVYLFVFSNNLVLRFGLGFFAVTYAPISNVIPLINTVNDRYLYLPCVGFCIVITGIINTINTRKLFVTTFVKTITGLAILFAFAVITLQRNHVFRDSYALYQEAVNHAPKNIRAHFNFAIANMTNGNFKIALNEFESVSRLNPIFKRDDVWYLMGICYKELNNPAMAKLFFSKSLLINTTSDAIREYSRILSMEGDNYSAFWLLSRGAVMFQDPLLLNDLGVQCSRIKLPEAAIICFEKAISLDPSCEEARKNLSETLKKQNLRKQY
ncbi:MAG: tetratricopeptide repeat protein [Elusimicrobia bacterium]|nr:tetratricopeptide repeat protein [Candidatus Liberimonas magnetica]